MRVQPEGGIRSRVTPTQLGLGIGIGLIAVLTTALAVHSYVQISARARAADLGYIITDLSDIERGLFKLHLATLEVLSGSDADFDEVEMRRQLLTNQMRLALAESRDDEQVATPLLAITRGMEQFDEWLAALRKASEPEQRERIGSRLDELLYTLEEHIISSYIQEEGQLFSQSSADWHMQRNSQIVLLALISLLLVLNVTLALSLRRTIRRDFERTYDLLENELARRKQVEEELEAHSKNLENTVESRTRALKETQEQLVRQEKLAVLGQLAGGVAHELRNPLGTISNSIYFLRLTEGIEPGKPREHLAIVERAVTEAKRVVDELLDYAGASEPVNGSFVVQDLIQAALEQVEISNGTQIGGSIEDEPLKVAGDREQIRRVLSNLVRNALQAMPGGGRLDVDCYREGNCAVTVVKDAGSGIETDDIAKVFEPLFSRKTKGIGLGLALSKRYVEAHGGWIECESEVGQGSVFKVVLPLERSDDAVVGA